VNIAQTARKIISSLLEDDDDDDFREIIQNDRRFDGFHPDLVKVLERFNIGPDQVSTRYSDVYVMCRTLADAALIRDAGTWKSMSQVFRVNEGYPGADKYPWGVDIPLANMGGYINSKPH
jgi:hypothetical protein